MKTQKITEMNIKENNAESIKKNTFSILIVIAKRMVKTEVKQQPQFPFAISRVHILFK